MRLDLLLIRAHPGLSRSRARAAIEKGQVLVDGRLAREPGLDLPEGASIAFDPNRRALPRARLSLPVLYEDADLVIVDKPAGLLSVPTPGARREDSALARVQEYAARLHPRAPYAGAAHRLDRDTTGALAFALSRRAHAAMRELFRRHDLERRYLALVSGSPPAEAGAIEAPISDAYVSGRRRVARPGEPARDAVTRYRVLERFAATALLELELHTGRQHQIRIHLAHLGLPVIGDRVYGTGRGASLADRPLLHARLLAFVQPLTGDPVRAASPLPGDFGRVLGELRSRRH